MDHFLNCHRKNRKLDKKLKELQEDADEHVQIQSAHGKKQVGSWDYAVMSWVAAW